LNLPLSECGREVFTDVDTRDFQVFKRAINDVINALELVSAVCVKAIGCGKAHDGFIGVTDAGADGAVNDRKMINGANARMQVFKHPPATFF